jgi:hypothetical protein
MNARESRSMGYSIAGTSIANGRGFLPVLVKVLLKPVLIPKDTGYVRKAWCPDRTLFCALKLH